MCYLNVLGRLAEIALKNKSHDQIEMLKDKILVYSGEKIMEKISEAIVGDY